MTDTSFSGHWQTLTLCFYRFLFITCSLAALGDCGLLALQLLNTFSHVVLRTQCAFILQNDKSVFDIESHTLLLHTAGLEPALHSLPYYCFTLLSQVYAFWTMGYAFEHPYLLSTAHSPPPCSFFGQNLLLPFAPIFRLEMLLCLMNPTLVSPNTRIVEPILLSPDFSAERHTARMTFTHHRSQQLPLTLSRA